MAGERATFGLPVRRATTSPLPDLSLANYSWHRRRDNRSWFEHDLCFRSFAQDLSTRGNGEGGSEQIREGASISQRPPTDEVERFLFILRFDSREKVNALAVL